MATVKTRRRERDSSGDPLIRFAHGNAQTDEIIHNHILSVTFLLWSSLEYNDHFGESNIRAAERHLLLIDKMFRDPTYARNFTEVDLDRIDKVRNIVFEWRKDNAPDEFIPEPVKPRREAHDVLGISPGATKEEIRDAYRRLVKTHHPDHNGNTKESTAKFVEIQSAYESLL